VRVVKQLVLIGFEQINRKKVFIIFTNINFNTMFENMFNEVNNLIIEKCGIPQELLHNENSNVSTIKMQNEEFNNKIIEKLRGEKNER